MVVINERQESYKRVGSLTATSHGAMLLYPTVQGTTDTEKARVIQLRELGHVPMVCLYLADNFISITDCRRESINDLAKIRYETKGLCLMSQNSLGLLDIFLLPEKSGSSIYSVHR